VTPVLRLTGVRKNYQSLRPLRVDDLTIAARERVAIAGMDGGAAEVLVNLVTGASLPDQGEVSVLDQLTSSISKGDDWLASLDRFGIVSPRGVLLDGVSIEQNIALVFTLAIDPIEPEIAARVAAVARACGIPDVSRLTGEAAPEIRTRVHLARAVALEPALLILEHPSAGLEAEAATALAADIVSVTEARGLAALVITRDETFARVVGHRALRLEPATGALKPLKRGWLW
jgi:ABC-type transporter Mla maintaining outer membrane lipid asymmetry ATPase subunit MlaF